MNNPVLAARLRETKGKGAARELRRNNRIPAVFYGPDIEPVMLSLVYPELEKILKQADSENVILDLKLESSSGIETKKAMLKDLQVDPVKDSYLHADFYQISSDREITVDVPIHLIGTPRGVTQGGVLQHIRRELTISCLPDRLISSVQIDVSEMDIGDALHIRDIKLPEEITSDEEGHLTVVVLAAPTVSAAEGQAEEAEEEVAEESTSESSEEP